jgi:hypothetical protein
LSGFEYEPTEVEVDMMAVFRGANEEVEMC